MYKALKHLYFKLRGGQVRYALAFEQASPKNHSGREKMIPPSDAKVVIGYLLINDCRTTEYRDLAEVLSTENTSAF
jgi:hypothetical protein